LSKGGRRKTCIEADAEKRRRLNEVAGLLALEKGVSYAAHALQISKKHVRYYLKKFICSGFHSGQHGGLRWQKYLPPQLRQLYNQLWDLIKNKPQPTVKAFVDELNSKNAFDPDFPIVSKNDVLTIFKKWKLTWKIPIRFQYAKYSPENMLRYFNYLYWFHQIPLSKVKYMDEGHFESQKAVTKKLLGPSHERVYGISRGNLNERITATVLLTPQRTEKPLEFLISKEYNTQWHFFDFIVHCVKHGALNQGDILVLDNAAIHAGLESYPLLSAFLSSIEISLVFLPAYSPELNPSELVFGFSKNYLNKYRKSHQPLDLSVIFAFSKISTEMVLGFYKHCASFNQP
jgi:hypothetical protein